MGIAACCASSVIMSEEGRLGLSGPEVIETAHGVEEYDARDRALVWRTCGGKHRYLLGDCARLVADSIDAFRAAALEAIADGAQPLDLAGLKREHALLARRMELAEGCRDPQELWSRLGVADPAALPMLEAEPFVAIADAARRQAWA
jgi:malonate decarboxylase beta subunit